MLQSALKYKKMGYSVIPVNPSIDEEQGKKAFISWTEFQSRIASEDEIKTWWGKWPKAMIGIVTGKISRIMAVDSDTKEAIDKAEELIPESLTVPICITPKNGRHYHFRYTNGFRNSNDGLLHVRGEGGYIIVPPSKRLDGKGYSWVGESDLSDLPELPATLCQYLKDIAFSLYRGVTNGEQQTVTTVTKRNILFQEGHRDEGLFHTANCLVKGGMERENIQQVLEMLAQSCRPAFSLKETEIKIKSAFERAERKEINLTEEVRQWVSVTNGNFCVTNAYQSVTMRNKQDRAKVRVILSRMVKDGEIERVSEKDGWFRRVEKDISEIDWESCDDTIINCKWPFELEQYYLCLPKNIIVIAGSPDAGKTAFCLNFAMLNMEKYQIKYFSSEMGALELKVRLKKFGIPFYKWKQVKFIERSSNFADVIDPDGLNVVDYIEVPEEAWKIATPINEIFRKLNKGICVIALQKPRLRDVARGGESTLDRPRLYLSMGNGQIKIVKCKNWANDERNPNGLSLEYKIVQGCKFIQQSDWSIAWEEVRR